MQSKLLHIKSKLRNNEELILGLLSILCFYAILISSLINDTIYLSVFFETGAYWPSLILGAGLLIISIFALISYYKGIFLIYASALSHVGLLYFYNLFAMLSLHSINYFRILNFSLWWLSLLISLKYFHLTSQKGRPSKYFFVSVVLFEFTFICNFFNTLLLRGWFVCLIGLI